MVKLYSSKLTEHSNFYRHCKAIELLDNAIRMTWDIHVDVKLGFEKYKKPYLIGYPDIKFNFSYSEDKVFCILSDMCVGLDAEKIADVPLDVASEYFTRDENEYFKKDMEHRFYEIWTKKESYLKYKGTGFLVSPKSFSLFDINDAFLQYTVWENTALAICAEKPFYMEEICII